MFLHNPELGRIFRRPPTLHSLTYTIRAGDPSARCRTLLRWYLAMSARISTASTSQRGPVSLGGTVAWVQIPVAHLSFETDIHFSIIHCFTP
jgi:hypothetical protein